jgi:hypothetical protein
MNDLTSGSDRAEEVVLHLELSDEVLEIACGAPVAGLVTLVNTYCFACPTGEDWASRSGWRKDAPMMAIA